MHRVAAVFVWIWRGREHTMRRLPQDWTEGRLRLLILPLLTLWAVGPRLMEAQAMMAMRVHSVGRTVHDPARPALLALAKGGLYWTPLQHGQATWHRLPHSPPIDENSYFAPTRPTPPLYLWGT